MIESESTIVSASPFPSQGRQALPEFHNALRILLNIDFCDLVQAGIVQAHDNAHWEQFQRDPFRYFIRADDTTAERLWDCIESRQPRTKFTM